MITLSKVGKKFNTVPAVSEITLTIKPGEIVGLLGPNGAGKTTTLRMIAGVLPPSYGTIKINSLTFLDNEMVLKAKIGYLPENNPLYDELTVEEHLHFWADMKGIEPQEKGIRAFVEFEKQRWTCQCGGTFCVHTESCSRCGANLRDPGSRKKDSRRSSM